MTTAQLAWLYLMVAGLFEVVFALTLKFSDGFTRLWPTLGVLIGGLLSLFFLAQAVRTLPIGTAYAVWTGIGAVGTAAVGILLLAEPRDALRLASIAFIVVGIAGLRLSAAKGSQPPPTCATTLVGMKRSLACALTCPRAGRSIRPLSSLQPAALAGRRQPWAAQHSPSTAPT
jgi:quaternary ammonium compound-resistance protein SugE